jgi:hypothetical protein
MHNTLYADAFNHIRQRQHSAAICQTGFTYVVSEFSYLHKLRPFLDRSHATDYRMRLGKRHMMWQFNPARSCYRTMVPSQGGGTQNRKNIKKIKQHA